jgi:hypothetical protein
MYWRWISKREPGRPRITEELRELIHRFALVNVIVFNEGHLRRPLRDYVKYFNSERVHTVLPDAPKDRPVESCPSSGARVIGLPRVI